MKINAIVTNVCESKSYTKRTGEEGFMTDIVVKWEVEAPGTQPYEQSAVMTVFGKPNTPALEAAAERQTMIPLSIYFEKREWNGRFFNNVTGYLPKEYMM